MTQLNTQWIREVWIPALESGEFVQGQAVLRSEDDHYCCLGVACELLRRKGALPEWKPRVGRSYTIDGHSGVLSDAATRAIGLSGIEEDMLARLNDRGAAFPRIADRIRTMCDEADAARGVVAL